jgi:nicotinamide-nucleotide amidase
MKPADLVATLRERGLTLAVAESLTGGLIMARLTEVPGVSDVLRGGVVTYATDTKASLLGVDADLLTLRGPVDPDVALAMAHGVRALMAADIGLATTGVAGPDTQAGHPVGQVFVAVVGPEGADVEELALQPDLGSADSERVRTEIRQRAVEQALLLASTRLGSL